MTISAVNTYHPVLTFLDDEALDRIHQTALRILSEIGVRVLSPDTLHMLAEIDGVSVDLDQQVATFAPEVIEAAIAQAPSDFTLYGRDDASTVYRRRICLCGSGSEETA